MIGGATPTIYALGDAPFRPGSLGGEMKCPTCGEHTPDAWSAWHILPPGGGINPVLVVHQDSVYRREVSLEWMECANKPECGEVVIRLHESYRVIVGNLPEARTDTWLVRPRAGQLSRPVNPLVPEHYRRDFQEAAAVFDVSPRLSAVMARRILADLLEEYDHQTQFSLTARVNGFVANERHPSGLREDLHYLRTIADFVAHTQKDDQARIINIDPDEAQWTIEIVAKLFDYLIVGPEISKAMRQAFDEKLEAAGRDAIPPLSDEPAEERDL